MFGVYFGFGTEDGKYKLVSVAKLTALNSVIKQYNSNNNE